MPGSSLLTVTWFSLPSDPFDSSRDWLERTTLLSGSNLSEVWVISIVVEVGRELHAGAAGADDRRDDRLHLFAQLALKARAPFLAGDAVGGVVGLRAVGQQVAALIDDRNPLRLQPVDGGGRQMADRADLCRLERAAHAQHDRGRRLRRFAREQRPFGQHQVHAGELHPVDGADGAGQFAFERAQVIDVLDEAGRAERVGLVEDLVADAAALRQAGFGELHAQPRHLVLRHHQHRAVVAHLEGNALAFQVLDDRGGVFVADRSVNSVVSCGVVTRMIRKPKNPIIAAVTATMAVRRAAPEAS